MSPIEVPAKIQLVEKRETRTSRGMLSKGWLHRCWVCLMWNTS